MGLLAAILLLQTIGFAHACAAAPEPAAPVMACHHAMEAQQAPAEQGTTTISVCKAHCDTSSVLEQRHVDAGLWLGAAFSHAAPAWPIALSLDVPGPIAPFASPATPPPLSILLGNFRS